MTEPLNSVFVVYLNYGWDGFSQPLVAFSTYKAAKKYCKDYKDENGHSGLARFKEISIYYEGTHNED